MTAASATVQRFVSTLSRQLRCEAAALAPLLHAERQLSPWGLDIARWATGAAHGPPLDYLGRTPVALVLTFVVQLATYQ